MTQGRWDCCSRASHDFVRVTCLTFFSRDMILPGMNLCFIVLGCCSHVNCRSNDLESLHPRLRGVKVGKRRMNKFVWRWISKRSAPNFKPHKQLHEKDFIVEFRHHREFKSSSIRKRLHPYEQDVVESDINEIRNRSIEKTE
jgi:hypothetical protein